MIDNRKLFNGVFKSRRILITGHTGFKGSWLTVLLNRLGAEVYGYALEPPTSPSLYNVAGIDSLMANSKIADIRDYSELYHYIKEIQPEIIIHMAAQSLVRLSYKNPLETYSTNVMGTVNLLEAVRNVSDVRVVVNVTTDKVYENKEWFWGYRETEPLGGYDPYSNSKGCSELVSSSYRDSFFNNNNGIGPEVAVATARAGNVIGGGDWAKDRLIPDIIKALSNGEIVKIRSPYAIRPWQHVLEPLSGYLLLASRLFSEGKEFAQSWNFGPEDNDARNVMWITKTVCKLWGVENSYEIDSGQHPHEANYLKLDCSKSKTKLGWLPRWNIEDALKNIVEWNKLWLTGNNMREITERQVDNYFSELS